MTDPRPVTELGYAEALSEIEAILGRLERDEPDVDLVAADVARAAELVRHCRARIADARLKVDEVVGDLAPPPAEPSSGAADAEGLGADAG